jgi:hypothetical protein
MLNALSFVEMEDVYIITCTPWEGYILNKLDRDIYFHHGEKLYTEEWEEACINTTVKES